MRYPLTLISALIGMALSAAPVFAAPRIPNDPYYPRAWYLDHIGVSDAWNDSLGFEGVIVAVIDSGVHIRHPDLAPNIWRNPGEIAGDRVDNDRNGYVDDIHGWDFVAGDGDPSPEPAGGSPIGVNHGTISASIIAARGDNGIGMTGVTWQTTILPIRALDSSGQGDPDDVVAAIDYAVANGAKIINMSFAGRIYNDRLREAVERAYYAGVFIVAAAGNAPEGGVPTDLDRERLYPVCLDADSSENFVYGVAALDETDRRAAFSNYGAGCVDGAAPGTRVIAAQYFDTANGDYLEPYGGYYNGTSVSAPIISGVAALMKAVNPSLTPKQITNLFTQTSFNIDEVNPGLFGKLGRGRVEAAKAVALAKAPTKNVPAPVASTQSLLPPGTGKDLIVTAPGAGRAADVRIFTQDGLYVRSFEAYPTPFAGGASLAVAKFNDASRQTIVTGAGAGGTPQVRIFNINTQPIGGFTAYDERFRGGVRVASGDVTGDGIDEIITGAGPGGGPHVRVFDAHGVPLTGFFPFEKTFRGGIDVASGDVTGDGLADIAVASGKGRVTTVRVLRLDGSVIMEFQPFGMGHTAGARVTVADLDGDGLAELSVRGNAAGDGTRVFDERGVRVAAYEAGQGGGSKEQIAAIVSGARAGEAPVVSGRATFYAYEPAFKGGVEAVRVRFGE